MRTPDLPGMRPARPGVGPRPLRQRRGWERRLFAFAIMSRIFAWFWGLRASSKTFLAIPALASLLSIPMVASAVVVSVLRTAVWLAGGAVTNLPHTGPATRAA